MADLNDDGVPDLVSVNNPTIDTLIADLNDSAVFSASGAHWEDTVQDWDNLSSDIRLVVVDRAIEPGRPQEVVNPRGISPPPTRPTAGLSYELRKSGSASDPGVHDCEYSGVHDPEKSQEVRRK